MTAMNNHDAFRVSAVPAALTAIAVLTPRPEPSRRSPRISPSVPTACPVRCVNRRPFTGEPACCCDFGLRFYAGVPLRTRDGFNLGTLCVIDKEPRPVDQKQIDDLKDLASVVMNQMELRLSARQAIAQAQLMAKEIDHRVTKRNGPASSIGLRGDEIAGRNEKRTGDPAVGTQQHTSARPRHGNNLVRLIVVLQDKRVRITRCPSTGSGFFAHGGLGRNDLAKMAHDAIEL
jgi:GAF domain-containing protein